MFKDRFLFEGKEILFFMKICTLGSSVFATNTYLVVDEDTNKAVLIDPDGNGKQIASFLDKEGYALQAILLTHGHFDHIGAVDALVEIKKVPVYVHAKDEELLADGAKNASSVFFGGKGIVCNTKPRIIKDTDTLVFGGLRFVVMDTPGHTRGSVCYFVGDAVFTGDTFFADGYGRTDLYGGNEQLILHSLRKLVTCMKGKRAYPGHGDPTDV